VRVAEATDGDAAQGIEIATAFGVPEPNALAALKADLHPAIGGHHRWIGHDLPAIGVPETESPAEAGLDVKNDLLLV
jgi:hypothetical protein